MTWRKPDAFWGTVFNSADPQAHAAFYSDLLGWRIHTNTENWVTLVTSADNIYFGFQRQTAPAIARPIWPAREGEQQMLNHLDIEVSNLEEAVAAALALGATLAQQQPQGNVRVMVDPEGQLFCFYVDG